MPKTYTVGLVGESNYQDAIGALREGDEIELVAEPHNPYDPRAIVARDGDGATIGYIPREHWIKQALLDEGKRFAAEVKDLTGAKGQTIGVVLSVVQVATEGRAGNPAVHAMEDDVATPRQGNSGSAGFWARAGAAAAAAAARSADSKLAIAEAAERKHSRLTKGCLWVIGILVVASLVGSLAGGSNVEAIDTDVQVKLQQDARVWYEEVMAKAEPCDSASERFTGERHSIPDDSGSMLAAYNAASVAQQRCKTAWRSYDEISIPDSFEGAMEQEAEVTLEHCKLAYIAKEETAKAAMIVFAGDLRPSAIETMHTKASDGDFDLIECAAGAMQPAIKSGLTVEQLDES